MSLHRFFAVALVFLASSIGLARSAHAAPVDQAADSPRTAPENDYLFAPSGRFSATVASGLPFLGIGELAYGVSDRFSLGAFGAATPDMLGVRGTVAIGLRPRGVLFQSGAWRTVLVVPVLFYPEVKGFGDREPWMLARPTLSLERDLGGGARVSVGAGLIAAACADSIFSLGREHTMMGGVWNTFGVGAGIPVSARTSVFAEASLVMRGVVPADDWIGGAPIVAFAGVTTSL